MLYCSYKHGVWLPKKTWKLIEAMFPHQKKHAPKDPNSKNNTTGMFFPNPFHPEPWEVKVDHPTRHRSVSCRRFPAGGATSISGGAKSPHVFWRFFRPTKIVSKILMTRRKHETNHLSLEFFEKCLCLAFSSSQNQSTNGPKSSSQPASFLASLNCFRVFKRSWRGWHVVIADNFLIWCSLW